MVTPADPRLAQIRDKVFASTRLSFDDGLYLDHHADLFTLGELANLVRERKNGKRTYYNVNTHLNPTNVCVYRCAFCSFRADLKSPKGYVMTDEQIVGPRGDRERVYRTPHRRRAAPSTPLRVVSGDHPEHSRSVPRAAPESLDGGRVGLVRAAHQTVDPRATHRDEGCGAR
jgi:hypothetical protein